MSEFLDATSVWLPGSIAMGGLVLCSGFFSASETAFFYLTHEQIRSFGSGNFRERMVAGLMRHPDRLLSAVLFWNLLINLMYFAASVVVVHRLSNSEQNTAAAIFGIVSLAGMILLGEVLPKSIAVVFRTTVAPLAAIPLAAAVRMLGSVLPRLDRIATSVRKWLWPDLEHEPVLSVEDLEHAVEASKKATDVGLAEQHVLRNILELSEVTAEELMRPRGLYASVAEPVTGESLHEIEPGTDCVIVTDAGGEHVVGAISLQTLAGPRPADSDGLIRDVVYVPWCASLTTTLQSLRDNYAQIAVVVSEHDLPVGIITYEDVMDALLLSQPGRTKRLLKREPVVEVRDGEFEVEGITTLRYLNRRLGLEHDPELDGSLTVAGLMHEERAEFPSENQTCEWKGHSLRVIETDGLGKVKVLLTKAGARR